jgi:hypothetical protein
LRASASGTSSAATGVANKPRTAMFIRVLIAYLQPAAVVPASRGAEVSLSQQQLRSHMHISILAQEARGHCRSTKARSKVSMRLPIKVASRSTANLRSSVRSR